MLKAAHLSNVSRVLTAAVVLSMALSPCYAQEIKKKETGLYRDVFDTNLYHEGLNYFHLERLYRDLFNKELRSQNVNLYDEIPDSVFFTNRHAKKRLSIDELKKGPAVTEGPDANASLTVTKGKFEGLNPGFWIEDSRSDHYLLKFDPADYYELATGAEMIASRIMHAIGYNVPQYTLIYFEADKLKPSSTATTYDDTGFKKQLTDQRLQEYLMFLPQGEDGKYRATASRMVAGKNLGFVSLHGRLRDDSDPYNHGDLREIRALRVFASWLNIYDIRETNTLNMLMESANGESHLKPHIIDFSDALGAAADGPKPPMFTHKHGLDFGEMTKAFFSLGFWKKPWQKRWEDAGMKVHDSPAVGYFDNRFFDPGTYKLQLPYYAFKDLTLADAFWAAKIILSFSDEEIKAVVDTAQYTNPEDADYIAKILSERRDLVGKYWFGKVTPLDDFDISGSQLIFKDLSVDYGFESKDQATYQIDIYEREGDKGKKISSSEARDTAISLDTAKNLDIHIRKSSLDTAKRGFVVVRIADGKIASVQHQD